MKTVLIIVGGAWMVLALLFCLALANAAGRALPTRREACGARPTLDSPLPQPAITSKVTEGPPAAHPIMDAA